MAEQYPYAQTPRVPSIPVAAMPEPAPPIQARPEALPIPVMPEPAAPAAETEIPAMADPIVTTPTPNTTVYVDGDSHRRHDDHGHGRAADHLAFESMTTPKDTIASIERHGNRLADGQNSLERSIDGAKAFLNESITDSRTAISGLVTDSSFRNLEQFGLAGVQAEKLSAATDVLVQKTTGEIQTQITLTAKDGIIDAAKNAAAITLQAEKLASAATLQAHQIAAAAAAAAAHCCCELKSQAAENVCQIKELIRAEHVTTRALVDSIEKDRVARELQDVKNDNSNLRQDERFRAILSNLSIGTGK